MTALVRWTPKARLDVLEIANYLAQARQLSIAQQFLEETERGLSELAEMPLLGPLWDSPMPFCKASELGRFRDSASF